MEYAPRPEREWYVVAFDWKDRPMLVAKNLRQHEADRQAREWMARQDVSRVEARPPAS